MRVVLAIVRDGAVATAVREALGDAALIITSPSIEDALRRLAAMRVDAIVLDELFGVGVVEQLRIESPQTQLIYLSGRSDAAARDQALASGAHVYLPKPFTCEALDAALEQCAPRVPRVATPETPALPSADHASALRRHQTAMRWLSRITGQIRDTERLTQCMRDSLLDVFDAACCAVLLDTNGSGTMRVAAHDSLSADIAEGAYLDFRGGLYQWFDTRMSLFDSEAPGAPEGAIRELSILGGRVAAPLICRGRVCGALVVGEMAGGGVLGVDEKELLGTIARCASVALENARQYTQATSHRQQLETIVQSITAGIVVIDEHKRVQSINAAGEEILSARLSDVRGLSVQKLGSGFADVVLRALRDGRPRLRQTVRSGGLDGPLGLSATPLPNGGVIAVFSRLPNEAAESDDELYSPFWEYLATRIAQEVKNPMVAINTFAQLLPRKYDNEEFRHAFSDVVQQEISRINGVVDTLNEFAHRPHLVKQDTDLNETVRTVLQSFVEELRKRKIEVEELYDGDVPTTEVDPIFFSQALHNVVQNSIDAMPEGGVLRVETRRDNNAAEVKISDTGPGVSDVDEVNVFLPYFSTREKGMGLGLTVAGRILKQHDGKLYHESTEDGGTAFALRVPLAEQR